MQRLKIRVTASPEDDDIKTDADYNVVVWVLRDIEDRVYIDAGGVLDLLQRMLDNEDQFDLACEAETAPDCSTLNIVAVLRRMVLDGKDEASSYDLGHNFLIRDVTADEGVEA